MSKRDEYLGCAKCRTVLFRLKGVAQDNAGGGFFTYQRVPMTDHTDHTKCGCGEPLTRLHKEKWDG